MILFFRAWKNYLLVLATTSYGTGIILHSILSFSVTVSLVLLCLALLTSLYCRRSDHLNFSSLLLCTAFLLFGLLRADLSDPRPVDKRHIVTKVGKYQQVALVGTLANKVAHVSDTSRVLMKVSFYRTETEQVFRPASGKVLLNLKGQWPNQISPGHSFLALATITYPKATNVPGTFDYQKFLARKKIFLTGFIQAPMLVQPVEQLELSVWQHLIYSLERLRSAIGLHIENRLPETTGSLYKALLIGDRSSIPPEVLEMFKRSGILHILAISGLHLGLVTAALFGSIYWLLRRSEKLVLSIDTRKWAMYLTLPLILVYTMLAGSQPPVLRAFIMVFCFSLSLACERLSSPLTTLFAAALLILLIDPSALESPSFQLSFAAVGSILLITPRLLSMLDLPNNYQWPVPVRVVRPLISLTAVTIAATLGTLPLMIIHFNRVSLVTLPSNLLIEPVLCLFTLPLGLASIPIMFVNPDISGLMLKAGAYGFQLSNVIATFLSSSESTQLWLPAPPPLLSALYYLALSIFMHSGSLRFVSRLSVLGIVATTACICSPLPAKFFNNIPLTRISILDVGHGSANVIQFSDNRVILIDGGSRNSADYDCGDRVISPYLWHRKISRVDDIIITHDDADHFNGIPTVIKRFKPKRLWLPQQNSNKESFKILLALAREFNTKIITPDPGVFIRTGDQHISVLGNGVAPPRGSEDDNGLVMRLYSPEFAIVFPGDITEVRERKLTEEERQLNSTILLSAHHGSASSNSLEFLAAVSPDFLIFSSGKQRKSLFPALQTLRHAGDLNIATLNTAHDGTIEITVIDYPPGYEISTFTRADRNLWKKS